MRTSGYFFKKVNLLCISLSALVCISHAGQLSKVLCVDMCGTNGVSTACHPSQQLSGHQMMQRLATSYNFQVSFTTNANEFTDATLKQYDVVVFNNVGNNPFTAGQQAAFINYIYNGGGYVGWHASAATHSTWAWYTDTLIGADIYNHGIANKALPVTKDSANANHSILTGLYCNVAPTRTLKDTTLADEWYFYLPDPSINPNFTKLLWITENGVKRAMSWCQEFNKGGTQAGRMFYSNCGQNNITGGNNYYTGTWFNQLIINALRWSAHVPSEGCVGVNPGQAINCPQGPATLQDCFKRAAAGKSFATVYSLKGQRIRAGTFTNYNDLKTFLPAGCHIVRFTDASGHTLRQLSIVAR
jgi:type 1 glutamine amidotransferase